ILLLIEGFALLICIKKTTRGHGSLDGFAVDEIKLLQAILEVFLLRYKCAILLLTDLKSEEKLQFTHHGHFIFLRHHLCKFFTDVRVSATKIISSIIFDKQRVHHYMIE